MQECAAGLVPVRHTEAGLAFAAPPLVRSGPVDEGLVERIAAIIGVERGEIVAAEWADNGPGWVAVMLASAEAVLALEPAYSELDLGIVGPYPAGSPEAFEVRAFFPKDGVAVEDPVTGSLNASLAHGCSAPARRPRRTSRARAPRSAARDASTSPPTRTGRSGSAAARSRA